MSNPFDDDEALFLVLRNAEGQYSLWPQFARIPPGWDVALPATGRAQCLEWIEKTWTDMRPLSLVAELDAR